MNPDILSWGAFSKGKRVIWGHRAKTVYAFEPKGSDTCSVVTQVENAVYRDTVLSRSAEMGLIPSCQNWGLIVPGHIFAQCI